MQYLHIVRMAFSCTFLRIEKVQLVQGSVYKEIFYEQDSNEEPVETVAW